MKKLIGYMLLGIGLAAGLFDFYLYYYYSRTLPKFAHSDTEQVIPMNNHGVIVYITEFQSDLLWRLQLCAIVIGIVGALIIKSSGKKKR
jgi:hypothetical protein